MHTFIKRSLSYHAYVHQKKSVLVSSKNIIRAKRAMMESDASSSDEESKVDAVQLRKADSWLRRLLSIPLEKRRQVLVLLEDFRKECAFAYAWSLVDDRYNIKLIRVILCEWFLNSVSYKQTKEYYQHRTRLIANAVAIDYYVNSPLISELGWFLDLRRGPPESGVKFYPTGVRVRRQKETAHYVLNERLGVEAGFVSLPAVHVDITDNFELEGQPGYHNERFSFFGGPETEIIVVPEDDPRDRRGHRGPRRDDENEMDPL